MTIRKEWLLLGALVFSLSRPSLCESAVRGECYNCHSMHNSEHGLVVAFTRDGSGKQVLQEQPFANLLKTDCLGCHSHTSAETIVNMGGTTIPIVFNISEPTYPPSGSATSALAGGNFHWVVKSGDAYGHNVDGIAAADPRFTLAPGGVERTGECINCHGTLATAQSGCEGCHVPHHHAGSAEVVAGREQGWYRFLGSVMQRDDPASELGKFEPTSEGVVGIESPDWEQLPLPDQHNTYQGKPGPYASYLESGALDQKCVGCHGQFHNETAADSTWIRHPVDFAIPDSGEFASLSVYEPLVPVARQNVIPGHANSSTITRGSDLISCVSCHRPHGSPYPAMLRWGYRDWPGTDSHTEQPAFNGCAVCHTSKD